MKTAVSAVLISLSLAAAGAAQAASPANDTASLTRAQVVAQLNNARAAGQISEHEADPYPVAVASTDASRSAVVAQLAMARATGQLNQSESDPYPQVASSGNVPRAQVLEQLAMYQAAHPDNFIAH